MLGSGQDALDIIGQTYGIECDWVVVPTARLADAFFDLKSGAAGEFIQKFANYRLGLAIVGDISDRLAASQAFRSLVAEYENSRLVQFQPSLAALKAWLGD